MTRVTAARDNLHARALALITRLSNGARDDEGRDALLCDLLREQSLQIDAYARLCRHRGVSPSIVTEDPSHFPAMPTDVFRYTRVATHPPDQDRRVFQTSGTTSGRRGQHALSDLSLYDIAARIFAQHSLFADVARIRLLILAPDEHEVPDSSLSYMLSRFVEWFGTDDSLFVSRAATLDLATLADALDSACDHVTPVALLGTSLAFLHAEDQLSSKRWTLPTGSRLMQTGGFKGKSREVEPEALRVALSQRYGIPESLVVQEYGMTELCSQMYESSLVDALNDRHQAPRRLIAPGWVRVTAVDPETLAPVAAGEVGIARIDDIANVGSVCAIQTADRIRMVDDGFVLLGRSPGSVPRGCSLATEEALG